MRMSVNGITLDFCIEFITSVYVHVTKKKFSNNFDLNFILKHYTHKHTHTH